MKVSLIKTDKHRQGHLSTKELPKFMDYLQQHPKAETVSELRHLLRYYVETLDQRPDVIGQLPRVYPSVELKRDADGNFVMKRFNGLLILTVAGLRDDKEIEAVKTAAQSLPMTVAAFAGASGRSVKLLVSVACADGSQPATETEAEQFCQRAYPIALSVYEAVLGRQLAKTIISTRSSFRLTLDPQPFFRAKSVPLLVNELATPKSEAAGTVADGGQTIVAGSEKVSTGTRQLVQFINENYELRHNTVMGYTEFLPKKRMAIGWQPVDERVQNSMAMEARLAGLNIWDKDISRYVRSTMVPVYNPIEEYLWSLEGKWDGKDHIDRLARTVPTDLPQWPLWFKRWLLAMVAQWKGKSRLYGNSIVPLLISTQGFNKSTFCRSLIPRELQWGYNDNLQLQDKKQVLQQMSQMLLINLDEFNQISPAVQQGFLKNIIQLPSVKVKRPYGRHVEEFPRLASFIATTNMADVLTDPSGSRRFIGVELKGPIDVKVQPNHAQVYAQALYLLRHEERYWFNDADTRAIMSSNLRYQRRSPVEQLFMEHFEVAANEQEGEYLSAAAIFSELRQIEGSILKPSGLTSFGRVLANIPDLQNRRTRNGTQYLVKRQE